MARSGCQGWQADGCIIAEGRDGFQAHVVGEVDGPFIVLLQQECPDQLGERLVCAAAYGDSYDTPPSGVLHHHRGHDQGRRSPYAEL